MGRSLDLAFYELAVAWADMLFGHNSQHVNAAAARARNVRVGDLVLEMSHRARANYDARTTLGTLIAIEQRRTDAALPDDEKWNEADEGRPCPTETAYVICDMRGDMITWTNASFYALPPVVSVAFRTSLHLEGKCDPSK